MPDVFFKGDCLHKNIENEYVAFVDIMGTRTHMKKSVVESANFIFKLHAAIISAWREMAEKRIFIYPVMDGAYITASRKEDMERILVRVYKSLADVIIKSSNDNLEHFFLIRGCVAYGEVVHGHNIPYSASKAFESYLGYKDQILLGRAMIAAYDGERKAAPFGIYIDDTAVQHENRRTRSRGCFSNEWKWYTVDSTGKDSTNVLVLYRKAMQYFEAVKNERHPLHYEVTSIEDHMSKMDMYFKMKMENI